jgi:hypothetical protein
MTRIENKKPTSDFLSRGFAGRLRINWCRLVLISGCIGLYRVQTPFLPESARVCQSYFAFVLTADSASPTWLVEALRGLPFCPVADGPSQCVRVLAPLSGFAPRFEGDATTHRHACIAARSWCGQGTPNSESFRESSAFVRKSRGACAPLGSSALSRSYGGTSRSQLRPITQHFSPITRLRPKARARQASESGPTDEAVVWAEASVWECASH